MLTTHPRLHTAAILLFLLTGCNNRHGAVLAMDQTPAYEASLTNEDSQDKLWENVWSPLPQNMSIATASTPSSSSDTPTEDEDKDLLERIKHWRPEEIRTFIKGHIRQEGEPLDDPYIVCKLLSISRQEYSKRKSSNSARGDQIEKFRQRVSNARLTLLRKQAKSRNTPMAEDEPSSSSSPLAVPAIVLHQEDGKSNATPTAPIDSRKRQRPNLPPQ
ncbi:MAG: hypothetical protein AAFQ78_01485 [Bacteroidota bacterium]